MKFLKALLYVTIYFAVMLPARCFAADSTGMVRFNLKNGLPSNHVYYTMQDRNGYMWFATDNGVVRYDGYSFKIFNTSTGLPSSDVWHLSEDGMGRIWLYMYAYELGYIKNDRYHKLAYESKVPVKLLDAVYTGKTTYLRTVPQQIGIVDPEDDAILLKTDISISIGNDEIHTYRKEWNEWKAYSLRSLKLIKKYKIPKTNGDIRIFNDSIETFELPSSNYFAIYDTRHDFLYPFHTVFSKGERFILPVFNNNINIITNKYWYIVSPKYKRYIKKDFRKILCEQDVQLTEITYDALQNTWLSSSRGIYLESRNSGVSSILSPAPELNSYRYAGYTTGGKTIWWDNEAMKVVLADSNGKIILRSAPMAYWSGFTIGNDTALYFETVENLTRWNTVKNTQEAVATLNSHITGLIVNTFREAFFRHNLSTIFHGSYLFGSGVGYGIHHTYLGKDGIQKIQLKEGRYDKVVYDTLNELFWYYNKNAAFVVRPADRKYVSVDKPVIDQLGLSNIGSLNMDRFGNLFIHHSDKLSIFNTRTKQLKQVNTNIKLANACVTVSRDHLLIANEAGLAIAQINGIQNIGNFHIALNVKDKSYTKINNLVINGDGIILQTDEGTYSTTLHQLLNADLLDVSDKRLMQLVIYTPDAYNLNKTDTISISDSTEKVRLDMVHLYGKGTKSYFYNIDNTGWQSAPTGEIFFPRLQPGYHIIQCYGTDELWQSNVSTFSLYKQPYWYQTSKWKITFWISGIILFLGIVLIAVLITRYLVQRANDKKRQNLELELRAIHSQINPHFIFNTLGTALFFISKQKMNEAYQHVHKFSRLLRSYLKASHDRYILLSDEIEMLRNYIELQQIRFEEKVDYNIEIDNKIPAGSIMVPSLLFQPLVENAINHGLFHLEDGRKGKLDISFRQGEDNNEIICTIEDNGVGRKRAKELKEQSKLKRDSYGTKLTQDLIDIFKEYERMDIYIEYTDKEAPDTGTIVTLTIRNLKYVA